MDSRTIKAAFAEAGIKVRVRAFPPRTFRVCCLGDVPHDKEASKAVAIQLGLVDASGQPGGNFNQAHEMSVRLPR
ncbi:MULTISPECIES: hypothetical protein [Ectopseudomonas]|jgi:hypothetical protein|uniref:Uncharacterized protein n=2 Tax=Ectopseudomonas TaxID=3236654 RepID=A0A1G6PS77_9GAMM|nr:MULTISPECIES: hypothetical protein [Pseudomonas]ALN21939.1 hypothetical protein DW68_025000 [Pseudomonas mendocina S5.2]KER98008.1 hypothetical protein HN51_24695 [Pseudomonas mendocina]MBP3061904.1 hypothetical protein [Pseudomonas chengduensis]NNB75196.1 hypothetical protein [Pseudomonas chengduensis]OEO24564.1 hypothetical protein AX279_18030 [Pseudomonas sp. J237]